MQQGSSSVPTSTIQGDSSSSDSDAANANTMYTPPPTKKPHKHTDVTVFTRFRDKWSQSTYSDMSNLSLIKEDTLAERKLQIIACATSFSLMVRNL